MYFQAVEIQNWMDKAGTFSKQQSFYLVRGRTKEKTQMEDTAGDAELRLEGVHLCQPEGRVPQTPLEMAL